MAVIYAIVSLIFLGILYIRMIKREQPSPVSKAQAVIPFALGLASMPVSFGIFMGLAGVMVKLLGYNPQSLPELPRAVLSAFFGAGFTEELGKLLMMLLAIRILRSKIRNVYEYIMVGAAVGFGFTVHEEFLYGSNGIVDLVGRFITIAGHMIFGMIMARYLGQAKYNKVHGTGSVGGQYALAFVIPMLIHTVYDTFTANNVMLANDNDVIVAVAAVFAFACIIGLCILQIKVLLDFKKNAQKYSDMTL